MVPWMGKNIWWPVRWMILTDASMDFNFAALSMCDSMDNSMDYLLLMFSMD